MRSINRVTRWILIIILISFLSIILSCEISGLIPHEKTTIPDTSFSADIVFSQMIEKESKDFPKEVLGYYSISNNLAGIVDLDSEYPISPYFIDPTTIIFLNKQGNFGSINGSSGNIVVHKTVDYRDCNELTLGDIYPFQGNIVADDGYNILELSSQDCSILRTLISKDDLKAANKNLDFNHFYQIFSFAISPDGKYLLFTSDSNLYKYTLLDKQFYKYDKNVLSVSAIAPDQSWVAYVAPEGIHIMSIDGVKDKWLVNYRKEYSNLPVPQWSPDSKKLIYHKCINDDCSNITDYAIFIYDIKTNKETKIIDSALYPSWNPYK